MPHMSAHPVPHARRVLPGVAVAVLLLLVLTGCAGRGAGQAAEPGPAPAEGAHPGLVGLNATLWMQTAAEYVASARQAYRAATVALPDLLADSAHSALADRGSAEGDGHRARARGEGAHASGPAGRAPAVILDVDETVLDNSPFQARLVREGRAFGPGIWGEWVREARAEPVPGALDFVRAAREMGVDVFYITNRDHELEPATRRNLRRAGFPLDAPGDPLLTEGEREGWGSDKVDRRASVAETHRVLMLVGDDLHDFVAGTDTTPAARRALARRHAGKWGRSWIMLPNPAYGSWERAAYGADRSLSPAEQERRKIEALEPPR